MKQPLHLHSIPAERFWLAGLIIAAALLITQGVYASGERVFYSNMPQQYVDLDQDGETELFAATMTVYDDGLAGGQLLITDDLTIDPLTGSSHCVDGVAVAKVSGTVYQIENGVSTEIGSVTMSVQPAAGQGGGSGGNGGGGDGGVDVILWDVVGVAGNGSGNGGGGDGGVDVILWDIIDAAVTGSLNFVVDPCAS